MHIGYVNGFVSNFATVRDFFTETIGLKCMSDEEEFGYASFQAGDISFAIAQTDDEALVGRHTGVGFMTADIDKKYQRLIEQQVEFEMPPTPQPWGGVLALFKDPDGNVYYLDPGMHH
jgi:predicted enzyme related to lactoylglutathione lyase